MPASRAVQITTPTNCSRRRCGASSRRGIRALVSIGTLLVLRECACVTERIYLSADGDLRRRKSTSIYLPIYHSVQR